MLGRRVVRARLCRVRAACERLAGQLSSLEPRRGLRHILHLARLECRRGDEPAGRLLPQSVPATEEVTDPRVINEHCERRVQAVREVAMFRRHELGSGALDEQPVFMHLADDAGVHGIVDQPVVVQGEGVNRSHCRPPLEPVGRLRPKVRRASTTSLSEGSAASRMSCWRWRPPSRPRGPGGDHSLAEQLPLTGANDPAFASALRAEWDALPPAQHPAPSSTTSHSVVAT